MLTYTVIKSLLIFVQITYVDFLLYELLDQNLHLEPTCLDGHANLKAFHERVRNLEPIAAYMKTDKYLAYPINGPMAAFGGN